MTLGVRDLHEERWGRKRSHALPVIIKASTPIDFQGI